MRIPFHAGRRGRRRRGRDRRRRRSASGGGRWGVDPDETTRALPGDDLVADPVAQRDPRDHDRRDRPSRSGRGSSRWASAGPAGTATTSSTARPERRRDRPEAWGAIKVGDIMPTHPGGGFEVVELQPDRALVLRSDTALVQAQAEAWAKRTGVEPAEASTRRPRGIGRDPGPDPAAVLGELGVRPRAARGRPDPPDRAVPRLVRRVRHGIACRDAGRRLRRLRDDAAPDARDPRPARSGSPGPAWRRLPSRRLRLRPSCGRPGSRSRRRSRRRRGRADRSSRPRPRIDPAPSGSAPATTGRRRAVGRPDAVG